jgi:hypothetical protein
MITNLQLLLILLINLGILIKSLSVSTDNIRNKDPSSLNKQGMM